MDPGDIEKAMVFRCTAVAIRPGTTVYEARTLGSAARLAELPRPIPALHKSIGCAAKRAGGRDQDEQPRMTMTAAATQEPR